MSATLPLDEARALAERREWSALASRGDALGSDEALREPEVAFLYADACRRLGRTSEALALAERVEPRARRRGDRHLAVNVVNLIGMSLFEAGRVPEARRRFEQLLEDAAENGDEEFAGRASNNLGIIAFVEGRRDEAIVYYQRALAAYRRLGYVRGLAQTHHNLGISYRDLGFASEADGNYRRAIELATAAGSEDVVALAELERAVLSASAGDGRLAEALANRAMNRFRRTQDPLGQAEAWRVLAAAARARGRDDLAGRRLARALTIARAHSDALLRAEVQRDRGILLRDRGRTDEAREALLDSAEHYERLGSRAEAQAVRSLIDDLSHPTTPNE